MCYYCMEGDSTCPLFRGEGEGRGGEGRGGEGVRYTVRQQHDSGLCNVQKKCRVSISEK